MSKVTIVGNIARIGEPKAIATGNVREVIVNKKYHDPDTGDLKSEDWYPVQVFEDTFEKYQPVLQLGAKVRLEAYVNGRRSEKDGTPSYFCNIVAKTFATV